MMMWARIAMAAAVVGAAAVVSAGLGSAVRMATVKEAAGTTYYVANSGNDAWDGLSAAHRGGNKGPWQTIGKINRSGFEAGDLVLLERGGTWREQLTVPSSGLEGKPLTFGAYAKGRKPLINLAERITEWRVYKGRIYVANVDFDVQQVFLDDAHMLLAHHPNDKHLRADEDSDSRDYLIDRDSGLSREQVEGASIHLLPYYFTVDDSRVISFDGARMTYESIGPGQPPMKKGKPYYLADKFWMLDAPGEWYYDKGAKQLYAWLPDGSPPGRHKIEATHGDYGVYAAQKHYLVIEEMEIRNAGRNGVQLEDCLGFRVANLSIHNSGTMKFVDVWESAGDGIAVTGRNNVGPEDGVISNNTIENSLCTGIRCVGIHNLTVVGNTVANTGLVGSPQRRRKKCRGGIVLSSGCRNALIRHNRILDCGYNGICFTHGKDTLVEENYIKDPLWIHSDGGAIKTGHAGSGGSRIVRNIITVSNTNRMARHAARGVYLDDNSHDVQVLGNTFVNAKLGIHVHNGHDHTLRGNTAYACTHGLAIQEDKIVNIPGITKNNIFESNIFFSTSTDCVFRLNGRVGHGDFATYDHNVFSTPAPENLVYETIGDSRMENWTSSNRTYDLASWQSVRGMDLHSRLIKQPGSRAPEKDSLILINPSVETKRFARKGHALPGRDYVDLDGKPVRWPVSVAAYGSKILVWDGKGAPE